MNPQVKMVTPEMARVFLASNLDNRNKRGWWVSGLASMIKRGEWIPTHQGVAFSKSGKLIDGQHRLEAIVESNTSVEMLVVTGVREDAYKVLDNGIKRTMADLTGLNQKTAEVCRILSRLVNNGDYANSAEQILDVYNTGVGEVHDNLVEYCGKNLAVMSSASVRAIATCMILDGHNQQYIKSMYFNLCNMKFNDLPDIAQTFIRQVNEKKVSANNKNDLMVRAKKVFDESLKNTTRLSATDSEAAATVAYCRNIIRGLLAKGNHETSRSAAR
jgi:hypothetical protein